jgi:hypothetical protein
LPLTIFWNANTGQRQLTPSRAPRRMLSFLSILALLLVSPSLLPPRRDRHEALIKYRHTTGTTEDWHREIASFIAALDGDPALKGKIGYRCMKGRDGADYYHLATVFDDTARVALQERAFFKHYTEATRTAAGGSVDVLPLDMIAETAAAA